VNIKKTIPSNTSQTCNSPFNQFNQNKVKRLLLYDEPRKSKATRSNSKRKQKNYGVGRQQF
jgi:hypothetical protein